jgi:5-methylthioadenosine/S-adenosylhomocysteine deaminase
MDVGTGWEAVLEFGLQGIVYQEAFGPADSSAEQALRELKSKVDALRMRETETLRLGVSPHAPYTVSTALYRGTADYARSTRLPMAAHIAESREEVLFVRDGAGTFEEGLKNRGIQVTPRHCLPVAYLDSLGLLGPAMLLIHAVEIDERDLRRIAETGTSVAHCPKSNAKLGHRIARLTEMRAAGVPVGLGTDSVASNNVVDMFEEMRAAVFHQRILSGTIDVMTAADAFRMATLDGARSLRLDRHLGSLEPGKRADFVVVDLSRAATQPVYDPIETMVYSASRADVKATFIGGKEVSVDDSEVLKNVAEIAEGLRKQT